jgi:transmembrane sensor
MSALAPHITEQLLLQFLLGEATATEQLLVQQWLEQSAENRHQLDQLEAVWAETGKLTPAPVAIDMDKAWQNLTQRINQHEQQASPKKTRVLTPTFIKWSAGLAAAFLLAFGIFKVFIQPQQPAQQLVMASGQTLYKGQLPDGSNIVLNLNTKLHYPHKFSQPQRQVTLKGEAFFEVAHNAQKPFVINAGQAQVKVLGTSFNVKAYPGADIEVTIATGKVLLYKVDTLTGDTASVYLQAGEKGIMPTHTNQPVKVTDPIAPDELYWMDQTLVFRQITLDKVFATLQKHYGVNIQVTNQAVLACTYTATYSNTSINNIMATIAATFNFELVTQPNGYTLKGNGCLNQ